MFFLIREEPTSVVKVEDIIEVWSLVELLLFTNLLDDLLCHSVRFK